MKILIIYAHPKSDNKGFSQSFLEESKFFLQKHGIEFEIFDLYEMNYDPIMRKEEHYTSGNKLVSPQNLEIQQKIKEADGMVFIYPVWWAGMPAVMKGFMDRVFTPGFAFRYRANKFLKSVPDKLLNDKKIAVFISSGGPKIFYKILLDPIKLINKTIIFGIFCSAVRTYQIYSASRLTDKKLLELKVITQKGLKWLIK